MLYGGEKVRELMRADSASSTAYLIAASTVFVSRDRRMGRFVPAHAAELCARFINARPRLAGRLLSALSAGRLRRLGALVERLTVPGIQLHYALRKRFIEEQTRAALAAGFTQAVVLGAGFDTLALRLCGEFPATRFFEIDHAHTQRLKIAALAGSEDARSRNLFFIPLDLARARLETALLSCAAFRRDAKTLFIAEGVLMYLAPGEVDELFRSVRDSGVCETRFVFTFMEPRRRGAEGSLSATRAAPLTHGSRGAASRFAGERAARVSPNSSRAKASARTKSPTPTRCAGVISMAPPSHTCRSPRASVSASPTGSEPGAVATGYNARDPQVE